MSRLSAGRKLKKPFVDTHAHLTSSALLPHLDALLKRAEEAGLSRIVNICTDAKTLESGLSLHQREPWILNAGATTPHDVKEEGEKNFELFAAAARSSQLVAIGETGLDYHYEHSPRELQREFLERYLRLAQECSLPVVFHCRDAFEDLFSITDRIPPKAAILHCFTGTLEEALEGVKRGWMISFSGILTFKKSEALRQVAREIPLDQIVLETDAPYLAPQSKRGQVNEPSFVVETAACLAALKDSSLDEVACITSKNAARVFNLSSLI